MRSETLLFSSCLLAATLASAPASAGTCTPVNGDTDHHRHVKVVVRDDDGSLTCDADVFRYNYRPRKSKG